MNFLGGMGWVGLFENDLLSDGPYRFGFQIDMFMIHVLRLSIVI